MRPQHHVQPLTNPPGHTQEPHERYRCKTTTKPTAATHQPPATETAPEGAQKPSKTLGLGARARCISSMGIFSLFWRSSETNQGGNKVARSGRKIEQNEVPKPCGDDAWAYPHSSKHAGDFPMRETWLCIFSSKTCLDYVRSVNVFMLTLWAILPAQVSLPSLVEVFNLLHNWIRSPSRPLNEDFVCHCRGTERHPKTKPKNKDQNWTQIKPQNGIRGSKFVRRRKQRPHDLHSAVCWSDSINKLKTSTKERKETWAGKIAQRVSMKDIHRPHIVKTCFTCKRYTVKAHAGKSHPVCISGPGMSIPYSRLLCFCCLLPCLVLVLFVFALDLLAIPQELRSQFYLDYTFWNIPSTVPAALVLGLFCLVFRLVRFVLQLLLFVLVPVLIFSDLIRHRDDSIWLCIKSSTTFEGLKAWKLEQNNMTKKGPFLDFKMQEKAGAQKCIFQPQLLLVKSVSFWNKPLNKFTTIQSTVKGSKRTKTGPSGRTTFNWPRTGKQNLTAYFFFQSAHQSFSCSRIKALTNSCPNQ